MRRILPLFLFLSLYLGAQPLALANKPYNELQIKQADLNSYPTKIKSYEPGIEITIGDLHGNALKLLYFLIRNDVLNIAENDYKQFVHLYKKSPEKLTFKDLILFQSLIKSANVNTLHKIRFLGDDLCDRGMNDFYTLIIYQKLDNAGLPFDVVLSNHGAFFLSALERPEQSFDYNPYGKGQNESTVQSMLNLSVLIERGLVDKQELIALIKTNYLKHLIFPGYTLNKNKNEITLYSHAPIDLKIISELAKELQIPYQDSQLKDLVYGMDAINAQIHQWIMTNSFTAHYDALNTEHDIAGTLSPIRQIIWNRNYSILNRSHEPEHKFYTVNYVHGHDSLPNVFDLDNLFGKGPDQYSGPYAIHVTHA